MRHLPQWCIPLLNYTLSELGIRGSREAGLATGPLSPAPPSTPASASVPPPSTGPRVRQSCISRTYKWHIYKLPKTTLSWLYFTATDNENPPALVKLKSGTVIVLVALLIVRHVQTPDDILNRDFIPELTGWFRYSIFNQLPCLLKPSVI